MNNRSLSFPYGIHEDASAMHLKDLKLTNAFNWRCEFARAIFWINKLEEAQNWSKIRANARNVSFVIFLRLWLIYSSDIPNFQTMELLDSNENYFRFNVPLDLRLRNEIKIV